MQPRRPDHPSARFPARLFGAIARYGPGAAIRVDGLPGSGWRGPNEGHHRPDDAPLPFVGSPARFGTNGRTPPRRAA